jgi:PadR family transcriptional regulator PadR
MLLAVVADAPAHGYAIIDALRQRSGGHLDVPEGTLYPALHRLERVGLVHSDWDEVAESGQRRRRVYALTPAGVAALRDRRRDWERFAASMASILGEASNVD